MAGWSFATTIDEQRRRWRNVYTKRARITIDAPLPHRYTIHINSESEDEMTDEQIKQDLIDSYANMSDGVRQCSPALPRNDREWARYIRAYRIIGGK